MPKASYFRRDLSASQWRCESPSAGKFRRVRCARAAPPGAGVFFITVCNLRIVINMPIYSHYAFLPDYFRTMMLIRRRYRYLPKFNLAVNLHVGILELASSQPFSIYSAGIYYETSIL